MNLKALHDVGEKLFGSRLPLMNMWQSVAENFYCERASFAVAPSLGEGYAEGAMTSYPMLVRRNLGDAFSTMLRPTQKEWFHVAVEDEEFHEDNEARRWLEYHTTFLRRLMYKPAAQFTRATKAGDHDFATFGQAVIEVRKTRDMSSLLYRSHHLRDVAWAENDDGKVCPIFRKWKPSARDLIRLFGDKVHADVRRQAEKDPFCEVDCRHAIVESDMWDGPEGKRTPYVSIFYDASHNNHLLEVSGTYTKQYVIPRWVLHESQYAYSPATWIALPEARLLQAMTHTLLEAGEKAVNPPMVARQEALRGDLAIYAGGLMWADLEPEQKLSEALALLTNDKSGIPLGVDMQRDSRALLAEIMFTSKLALPPPTKDMTAFEVAHRIEEWIRGALPLFEPVENDYNAGLCEMSFETAFGEMLRMEARGIATRMNIPRKLRGAELTYTFESPLHDAIEKQKSSKLLEAKQIIGSVIDIYPNAAGMLEAKTALREALQSTVPANWLPTEAQVADQEKAMAQAQQAQQMLGLAQQSADVVKTFGEAAPALREAA